VQWQLRRLLDSAAGSAGAVTTEIGFRALPEYEYRIADVAFISQARWEGAKDYLEGAPEIVIEVLSPSNTMTEMLDREKLCLENGCQEFWVVDIDRRQVKVSTPDGRTITYRVGQEIPLPLLNDGRIPVDAIFAPAEG
jgi:Uma2 family endonuclease